jgi:hypothetical protein
MLGNKRLVYLEWIDAEAENTWTEIESIGKLQWMPAAGFLVKEDKDSVTLALTHDDVQANSMLSIPKKWTRNRQNVTVKTKKNNRKK